MMTITIAAITIGIAVDNSIHYIYRFREEFNKLKNYKETLNEDIRSMAGVPSWMMVLLQKILSKSGKSNILEIWPNMEVYFHGGVNFIPYKNQYKKLFPSSEMNYIEIYNASEGFFGVQDRLNSDDMLLMLDYGIFYEFIAMSCYG